MILTLSAGSLTKGADFVHAFMLGFAVEDAMALLRLEDIYVDSFDISDGRFFTFCLTREGRGGSSSSG